jgi:hypothetical protein
MKKTVVFASLVLVACAALWAQNASSKAHDGRGSAPTQRKVDTPPASPESNLTKLAVEKGAKWLASVQGADGGWGQDGGSSQYNNNAEGPLSKSNNDVANTAVAALALLRAGDQYKANVERAVHFVLRKIEASPADGLSITDVNQTQIQRKLGPHIDTFLASMLLAEIDGTPLGPDKVRARKALEKCVAKIEKNQMQDGSWNFSGGWAPIFGTSLASRGLFEAGKKGVKVDRDVLERAQQYFVGYQKQDVNGSSGGVGSGKGPGSRLPEIRHRLLGASPSPGGGQAAGVQLYKDAQSLEQLTRTPDDRRKNAREIEAINQKLSSARFVDGYGSVGGEEFFSYLNISDSLRRSGGKEWSEWYSKISQKIFKLQNDDGSWAGHHCITGRCAVTSAAILNLTSDREY